ncbi:MAG: DUF1801 domain-containing protein [Amphiplicatus sp.]
MATRKTVKQTNAQAAQTPVKRKTASAKPKEEDIDSFFAALKHPLKKEFAEVRRIVLGSDRKISEGVKWNSVSFKTADYFATINWRSADSVQLVLHRGAKSVSGGKDMDIPDPKGLLKWLSTDRALLTLGAGPAFAAIRKALEAVIRAWVKQL